MLAGTQEERAGTVPLASPLFGIGKAAPLLPPHPPAAPPNLALNTHASRPLGGLSGNGTYSFGSGIPPTPPVPLGSELNPLYRVFKHPCNPPS